MASSDYRVASRWRVHGRLEDVADVLGEPASWQRWWPAAFLRVLEGGGGCAGGVGRWADVHTKGWLPYTLRLRAEIVACNRPHGCRIAVTGDFEGSCLCSLRQDDGGVEVLFDWRVRVRKRLVRRLSWVLKPLFIANHKWVMRQGRRSLEIELRRRRALAAGLAAPAETPPQPTFPYGNRYRWLRHTAAATARSLGCREPQRSL